ncbi:hypothetical protein WNY63_21405 [Pseudoalteromonas neustonica]|uniref:GAF domain-containing protein n=1 Tax=Pseudoalteromonas neustonica TaxID=1840331 RepID=A0ABU9U888_9GAMM
MKVSTKKIDLIVFSPWYVLISGLCSILGFLWFLYDKYIGEATFASSVFLVSALTVLSIGYLYSIRVRLDNIALRQTTETYGEINELYRDALSVFFSGENPITCPKNLVEEEKRILFSVCQRIENIFARVINRECTVTIKLLVEENNKIYAETMTRSVSQSIRDTSNSVRYEVNTGANTAFDEAIRNKVGKKPAHFYSPNLKKLDGYRNQRQNYIEFYKSVLVVPIRGRNVSEKNTAGEFDYIGFLCIDTKSTNRLNNNDHLNLLMSFANQMYNFSSLMRGRYTVFVG